MQILLSHLQDLVKENFGEVVDAKQLSDILSRVAACSEVFGTKGRKYVDQERFLTLCMQERTLPPDAKRPAFPVVDASTAKAIKSPSAEAAKPDSPQSPDAYFKPRLTSVRPGRCCQGCVACVGI